MYQVILWSNGTVELSVYAQGGIWQPLEEKKRVKGYWTFKTRREADLKYRELVGALQCTT